MCYVQKKGEISFTNEQVFALIETNKQLAYKVEQLEQTLAQFKKLLFDSKHERVALLNPAQLSLDMGLWQ